MQAHHVLLHEVIVLDRAQELDALLDVLREDQPVLLEDLLDLRDFEDFLLKGGELGLGLVFVQDWLVLLLGGLRLGGLEGV